MTRQTGFAGIRAVAIIATLMIAACVAEPVKPPASAAAATPATTAPEPVMKVVWHVDFPEPRRLSAMIQNVNNMVTTYQSDLAEYDVHIVFVGAGIRFVTEDPLARTSLAADKAFRSQRKNLILRLQQLREMQNVKLELCEITRESVNLPADKVIPGVEMVRSGVVRIAELQHKGYAYLKAE